MFNKYPWYNTAICSKLHGKLFEDFIRHARTDMYHLMCSIISHDKKQPSYEYVESINRDGQIPKNETAESLKELGTTLNSINFWFKLFHHNYSLMCGM